MFMPRYLIKRTYEASEIHEREDGNMSGFLLALPVSQRIWTPPRIWTPRSRSASGFGPPGPNPLVDMHPLSRIWTPLKTSVLLSKIGKIVFWSC